MSGRFGYPPAGLRILGESAAAAPMFAKAAPMGVLSPDASLRVGAALAPYLTSSMDSSDGLARSVHTLARESRVGFALTSLPAGGGVAEFASSNGLDWEALVLEGGEEYVIVGTVKRRDLVKAKLAAHRAGGELLEIGRATRSRKVELVLGGAARPLRDAGWTHLG